MHSQHALTACTHSMHSQHALAACTHSMHSYSIHHTLIELLLPPHTHVMQVKLIHVHDEASGGSGTGEGYWVPKVGDEGHTHYCGCLCIYTAGNTVAACVSILQAIL
jgi:hypothetical protein